LILIKPKGEKVPRISPEESRITSHESEEIDSAAAKLRKVAVLFLSERYCGSHRRDSDCREEFEKKADRESQGREGEGRAKLDGATTTASYESCVPEER
jgi:hypothetical protein